MEIKVLGTGCPKCKKLEQITREVITEMNVEATISKVEDITKIMEYGVMLTPALVINEKVIFSGQLPSANEIKEQITKNQ